MPQLSVSVAMKSALNDFKTESLAKKRRICSPTFEKKELNKFL